MSQGVSARVRISRMLGQSGAGDTGQGFRSQSWSALNMTATHINAVRQDGPGDMLVRLDREFSSITRSLAGLDEASRHGAHMVHRPSVASILRRRRLLPTRVRACRAPEERRSVASESRVLDERADTNFAEPERASDAVTREAVRRRATRLARRETPSGASRHRLRERYVRGVSAGPPSVLLDRTRAVERFPSAADLRR